MVDAQALHGTWFHSHEEDQPGTMVFRPQGYDFPPARGRFGYSFEPDGRAQLLGPGADDRRTSKEGRWSLSPGGILTIDSTGSDRQTLSVQSASPEKLVLNN